MPADHSREAKNESEEGGGEKEEEETSLKRERSQFRGERRRDPVGEDTLDDEAEKVLILQEDNGVDCGGGEKGAEEKDDMASKSNDGKLTFGSKIIVRRAPRFRH